MGIPMRFIETGKCRHLREPSATSRSTGPLGEEEMLDSLAWGE